jgi:hypothetical protein
VKRESNLTEKYASSRVLCGYNPSKDVHFPQAATSSPTKFWFSIKTPIKSSSNKSLPFIQAVTRKFFKYNIIIFSSGNKRVRAGSLLQDPRQPPYHCHLQKVPDLRLLDFLQGFPQPIHQLHLLESPLRLPHIVVILAINKSVTFHNFTSDYAE